MSNYYLHDPITDSIHVTCKICGKDLLCKRGEDPTTKRCRLCGHRFGTRVQHYIDDSPDASSDTHNRYSWFCGECEHRGLKWMKSDNAIQECPNCKVGKEHLTIRALDPEKGRCKTIWEQLPLSSLKPIALPKKKFR